MDCTFSLRYCLMMWVLFSNCFLNFPHSFHFFA
uniref:Uncharacterized protein n=1 Tax=Arundo donax TaxID=35708 RepID=A0A0A9A0D2_ARUDO